MAFDFQQNAQLFDMSFHSISLHLLLETGKERIYKKEKESNNNDSNGDGDIYFI